jgi:hypothetical protein
MNLDPEFGELFGDNVGGALFLERGFGMGMNIATPLDEIVVKFGDAVDDGHG